MGLRAVAVKDGMTEGDRSVLRSPVTVWYRWVGACLVFPYIDMHNYSPLVTEPTANSVFDMYDV